MKRLRVLLVLLDLAINRLDVREHIPVPDDDALGLGGCARRENDLNDVVPRDGDIGPRAVVFPSKISKKPLCGTPEVHAGSERRDVVADEEYARVDEVPY